MRFARLVIPDLLLEGAIEHARLEVPRECCGLLAGHISDGTGTATVRFPITNDAAGETRYETNPRDLLRAFRAMREGGLELLAIYHSHPASAPVPSARDIEMNTYGETAVHLIVGFVGGEPVARAWWLAETGCREAPLEIARI